MIPSATSVGEMSPAAAMASKATTIPHTVPRKPNIADVRHGADVHRPKEAEHRRRDDKEREPYEASFEEAHFNRAVGDNRFLDSFNAVVGAQKSGLEYRSNRATRVRADLFGRRDTAFFECLLDTDDELTRVDVGAVERDNALE